MHAVCVGGHLWNGFVSGVVWFGVGRLLRDTHGGAEVGAQRVGVGIVP